MRKENPPPTQRIILEEQAAVPETTRGDRVDLPPTRRADTGCGASLMQLPSALSCHYTIKKHLPAKGAESDIFLVANQTSGKDYIAKVYRQGIECKPEVLERLSNLDQRHIVEMIEYGQSDGRWYELMEYMPFGTLGQLAEQQDDKTDVFYRSILTELHQALTYLHENNIFHRDLKPENILVRNLNPLDLVLTDFGIASLSEASVRFTRGAWTLHYTAPEQIVQAATISGKTDYWSLGMILFEIIHGSHPFAGLNDHAISAALATGGMSARGVVPFSDIKDERWRLLCQGLLTRDPEKRWGQDEVSRWLDGDTTLKVIRESSSAVRPYKFNKQEFYTPEELAPVLAGNWDEAVKHLHRKYLSKWFSGALLDQELAEEADDLLENENLSKDKRLHLLLIKMAPDLPPFWKGACLATQDLVVIATRAINGDKKACDLLAEIYDNDVLANVFAETYASWKKQFDLFEQGWKTARDAGAPEHLKPAKQTILPSLLLLEIEREYAEKLREQVCKRISSAAKQHSIIKAIGTPEDVLPTHLLVLQAISKKADQEINEELETIRNTVRAELLRLKNEYDEVFDSNPKLVGRVATIESVLKSSDYEKIYELKTIIKDVQIEVQHIADLYSKTKNNLKLLKSFGVNFEDIGTLRGAWTSGDLPPDIHIRYSEEFYELTQQCLDNIEHQLSKLVRELMRLGYDSDTENPLFHPQECVIIEDAVSAKPKLASIREALKITQLVKERKPVFDKLCSELDKLKVHFVEIATGNNSFANGIKQIEKSLSEPDKKKLSKELNKISQLWNLGKEVSHTFKNVYLSLREIIIQYDEILFSTDDLKEKIEFIQSALDSGDEHEILQAKNKIDEIHKQAQLLKNTSSKNIGSNASFDCSTSNKEHHDKSSEDTGSLNIDKQQLRKQYDILKANYHHLEIINEPSQIYANIEKALRSSDPAAIRKCLILTNNLLSRINMDDKKWTTVKTQRTTKKQKIQSKASLFPFYVFGVLLVSIIFFVIIGQ